MLRSLFGWLEEKMQASLGGRKAEEKVSPASLKTGRRNCLRLGCNIHRDGVCCQEITINTLSNAL